MRSRTSLLTSLSDVSGMTPSTQPIRALSDQNSDEMLFNDELKGEQRIQNSSWQYFYSFSIIIFVTIAICMSVFVLQASPVLQLDGLDQKSFKSSCLDNRKHAAVDNHNRTMHIFNVYLMKTKLAGVTYTGDHWFHMSENFLTHHSSIERVDTVKYSLDDNAVQHIVYVFDKGGFVDQMTAITRYLVILGTTTSKMYERTNSGPAFAHFVSLFDGNIGTNDVFDLASLNDGKSIDLTVVQSNSRFVNLIPTSKIIAAIASENYCFRYQGSVGGHWPTIQRGHWFPQPRDVKSLRYKMARLCPPQKDIQTPRKKQFKLVVYQRDRSRKLADENKAIQILKEKLPKSNLWDIQVLIHESSRSPCELANLLFDVDVLVTPHGFQSMLLFFLPRKSILFEIFPFKYYKRGYGPLSSEYGVLHAGTMSPPTSPLSRALWLIQTSWCMSSKQCRNYARNHDVRLTVRGVNALVEVISGNEQTLGWSSIHVNQTSVTCSIPSMDTPMERDYLYTCN